MIKQSSYDPAAGEPTSAGIVEAVPFVEFACWCLSYCNYKAVRLVINQAAGVLSLLIF
jgi:hypothetical protein